MVNLEGMFANKKVHEQAEIFNKVLMKIFSNFIPNKNVNFNDPHGSMDLILQNRK